MAAVADEFETLGELGRGGYGQVFAARHRASGREVAIKVLASGDDPQRLARFLREARVDLASPYVVKVFDVRVEGANTYLIMERVAGVTADALGPLSVRDALWVAEQAALGLAAAHDAGLIHRDVKPQNLLVDPQGNAKLADFGIAKDVGTLDSLTASGQGLGTLAYVAPEQAANAKHVDHRADLYGLGATLYHLLGGRPPFRKDDPELVLAVFERDPPPLRTLRPDCPPEVEALVSRLMEKDPRDRPPTARSVAKKLSQLRERC